MNTDNLQREFYDAMRLDTEITMYRTPLPAGSVLCAAHSYTNHKGRQSALRQTDTIPDILSVILTTTITTFQLCIMTRHRVFGDSAS